METTPAKTDQRINHEGPRRTQENKKIHPLLRLFRLIVVLSILAGGQAVMAQSPTPSPSPGNSNDVVNADALTNLVIVAGNLIPRVQEAVESPLIPGLENLAFWIAVIVMTF